MHGKHVKFCHISYHGEISTTYVRSEYIQALIAVKIWNLSMLVLIPVMHPIKDSENNVIKEMFLFFIHTHCRYNSAYQTLITCDHM